LAPIPQPPLVILDGRLENHSAFEFRLPPKVCPIYLADSLKERARWGDLWYGSYFEGKDKYFISHQQAWALLNENRAVYCMEKTAVPPGAPVLCEAGDMAVVASPTLVAKLRR
jgi:hypothetical protein